MLERGGGEGGDVCEVGERVLVGVEVGVGGGGVGVGVGAADVRGLGRGCAGVAGGGPSADLAPRVQVGWGAWGEGRCLDSK